MLDLILRNKLVVFVLVVFIGAVLWYSLGGGGTTPSTGELLVTQDFTQPTSEADRDIVESLIELRTVTLDGTIFSDPVFESLTDFGSQIVPEPVGRPNPFEPLNRATPTLSSESEDLE